MRIDSVGRIVAPMGLLAIMSFAPCRDARAQDKRENYNATLRADCRLALQVIVTGKPEPKWDWALDQIAYCDDTAGEALPVLLRRASTDSLEQLELLVAGRGVRDQRILDAAIEVAQNGALTWRPRVSAMRVMVSYINRSIVIEPEDIMAAPGGMPRTLIVDHAYQIDGTHPLSPSARSTIRTVFEALASADQDARVRAAGKIFAGVARNYPAP